MSLTTRYRIALASTALALPIVLTGTAFAVSSPAPRATSGSATLAGISPDTSVDVGGGTWNYGSSYSFPFSKKCWSNYFHPTLLHSGTAIIGSTNITQFGAPEEWADATAYGPLNEECQAYWDTSI